MVGQAALPLGRFSWLGAQSVNGTAPIYVRTRCCKAGVVTIARESDTGSQDHGAENTRSAPQNRQRLFWGSRQWLNVDGCQDIVAA
jgi:hypothetical protein